MADGLENESIANNLPHLDFISDELLNSMNTCEKQYPGEKEDDAQQLLSTLKCTSDSGATLDITGISISGLTENFDSLFTSTETQNEKTCEKQYPGEKEDDAQQLLSTLKCTSDSGATLDITGISISGLTENFDSLFTSTETQNEKTMEVKNSSEDYDCDSKDFSPSDGSDFDPKTAYESDDSCEQVKEKKDLSTKGKENMNENNNKEGNVIKKVGKRTWNRKNACFYCQELVTNFSRHLLRRHNKEIEVIEYKSIQDEDPKIRQKKRQAITNKLRNKGNFLHNCKVSFDRDEGATVIPSKRDNLPSSPSSYATCKHCLGTFKRSSFFRHLKGCDTSSNNEMNLPSLKKKALYNHSITIIPNTLDASVELKNNILPHLRSDDISLVVKNDPLIIAYGSRLLKKKKERRSRKAICSKMRDLASLLSILRKKDPSIEALTDVIEPEKYETFIDAIKTMCGFNEETGMVNIPSIPARLRPAILGCIDILYTQAIMSTDSLAYKDTYKKKLDDFKRLIEINWQWEISSNAEKTRKRVNMTKQSIIPLDEDIATVMQRIHKMEIKYAKKLREDRNPLNYESLCIVTIAHIIMLDRKRAGDVAEAELTFYINRKNEEVPEKVLETLTSEQRKSIQELDVFQIPGKRTRAVPILLTKIMRENIDLIIACRGDLNIPSSNRYLFARPGTEEPFDGGKCLEKIKKQCNLKRPEMLTSTGMRHHIATMSQIHSKQNDQYTEHLAGFLGHDVAVHARNYRLPLQVLQKAVVGTQLIEYENTQTENKQKKIETITSRSDIFKDTLDEIIEKRGKSSDVSEQPSTLTLIPNSTFETNEITTDYNLVAENEGTGTINLNNYEPITSNPEYEESGTRNPDRPERRNSGEQEPKAKNDHKQKNMPNHVPKTNKTKVKQSKGNTSLSFSSDSSINEENAVVTSKTKKYEAPETDNSKVKQNRRNTRTNKSSSLTDSNSTINEEKTIETSKTKNYEKPESKNKVKQNKRKIRTKKLSYSSDSNSDDDKVVIKRSKTAHRKWSHEEIKIVQKHFQSNINQKINPGKSKCEEVLKKEPALRNRTWMQLNTYVNNIYKKKL